MRSNFPLPTTINLAIMLGLSAASFASFSVSASNIANESDSQEFSRIGIVSSTHNSNQLSAPTNGFSTQTDSTKTTSNQLNQDWLNAPLFGSSSSAQLEQDPNAVQDNSIKDQLPGFGTNHDFDLPDEETKKPNAVEQDAFLFIPTHSASIESLQQRAENNDIEALLQLAFMYASGDSVEQDFIQAHKWFSKAAELGNVDAQFYLGAMYLEGDGVEQDFVQAKKWLTKAAEQGDPHAQCGLGVMYYEGRGVDKDFAQAFEWFSKAAMQDNADAQYNLAEMYEKGEHVTQDTAKAREWFNSACELGDNDACERAANMEQSIQMQIEAQNNEPSDLTASDASTNNPNSETKVDAVETNKSTDTLGSKGSDNLGSDAAENTYTSATSSESAPSGNKQALKLMLTKS